MGTVRKPRAWFKTDSGLYLELLEAEVNVNRFKSSDTFNVTTAISQLPPEYDEMYWSEQTSIEGEVMFSENGDSDPISLIKGVVDQVEVCFDRRTLRINGRDLAAKLIDSKTTEKFNNKTPVDIVKEFASKHGLKVEADAETDKQGKYYDIDFAKLTDEDSQWNAIVNMAERQGFDCYVKGDTLYYKKADDDTGVFYDITYVPPTSESYARGNWTKLRVVRNLTLSKKVKVKVRSFNSKQNKVVNAEKEISGDSKQPPLLYEYRFPGLTQEQADKIADKRLQENAKHEITVEVNAPGDLRIDPRMKLSLRGTNTKFDQDYFIDAIQHSLDQDGGYRMTVRAKNKSKDRK